MAGRFSVEGEFRIRDRMSRTIDRIRRRMGRFESRTFRGFRQLQGAARELRTGLLAVGAAVTAIAAASARALQDVIETGVEFDAAVTAAAAKFPGRIRRGTEAFQRLEEAAQRTGRETEFTGSQAAQALDFLAMAGFNAEQAVAALPGVVDLATSAQMELAEATDIASDTLGAFGLMTQDAAQLSTNLSRVNDVLARTSTSANTTVEQMFEAIRMGGSTARAAGASIETFSSMLGELAGAGIKGGEAGTALRNVFLRLQNPVGRAARHLRRLRIETEDGEGNFRDIIDILGQFEDRLDGMGSAERARILSDVFGARAVNAVNTLLASGSQRLSTYRTTLEGAEGAATEMAATMRDTAGGDMASLGSAVEGLKLQIWDLVRGPFRDVVQGMTEWVRANQGAISGAIGNFMAFLDRNQDTIRQFGTVLAVVLAVVVAAVLTFGAVVMATAAVVPGVIVGIITAIVSVGQRVYAFVSGLYEEVKTFARETWAEVTGFFRAVQEFAAGVFVLVRSYAMHFLGPLVQAVASAAASVRAFFAPVGAFLGELWAGVSAAASAAWSWISESAGGLVQTLREVFAPIGEFFSSLWEGIADSFGRVLGGILGTIGDLVDEVRGVGRGELAVATGGGGGSGAGAAPQVVTPSERVARSISESRHTERAEITVRAEPGSSAEVRRPRPGQGLRVAHSGGL